MVGIDTKVGCRIWVCWRR